MKLNRSSRYFPLFIGLLFFSFNALAQLRANFSGSPTSGCTPLVVNFTDQSTGNPTGWRWDLGNGTTSFIQNPSGTYFAPGTYNVKLVVTNSSGIDSVIKSQYITVYATPIVNFNGTPQTGCFPLTVQFTDMSVAGSGTISNWDWDFGDGFTSTIQNPSHTYTAAGNYNVSLLVKNNFGCIATVTRTSYIQISSGVHADFTNTTSNSCNPPVTITFQNHSTGSGILSYQWSFGDGTTSTAVNPSHTYNTNGNFTVQLIVTNSTGCSDTLTKVNDISLGAVSASFTVPASVCQGVPLSITNTSTPTPASVLWTFGDGTTSTAMNPVKTYSVSGTFTIKLLANFGACSDSASQPVTVLPKPTAAFTADKTYSCQAPLTVTFTNGSTGAISYQWTFGDGGTSTNANPAYIYTTPGTYNVTLIATNASGCSDTLIKTGYIVIQPPTVTFQNLPDSGCAPLTVPFGATIVSGDPVVTYLWDFGDGTTGTGPNPTHTYNTPGVYDIKLIITTASGCIDTATYLKGVKVGAKPHANFSANPLNSCAFKIIDFTDSSTGNPNQWFWSFGDGGVSTQQDPTHHYTDTGFFNITLVVWSNGCADTVQFMNYIHILPPIASFKDSLNCIDPFTRIFIDKSVAPDSWSWSFGDGTTSTIQNPSHTYAATGVYTVQLIVTNNLTGCSDTTSKQENIINERADFIADQTSVCKGTPINFSTVNINPVNIASYFWDFGDGFSTNSSTGTITHTYFTSGVYSVSLKIVNIQGCPDSLVKPLYITVSGPTAGFSNNGGCLNSPITFNDTSRTDGTHRIVQWVWNYGDGTIQTYSSSPFQHTYTAGGTYIVSLTVKDSIGCSDSISRSFVIHQTVADFTGDTLSCGGKPISFTNLSTGTNLTYVWNFGDGTTSGAINPVHVYPTPGVYDISLRATDQFGCSDSISKPRYVTIANPLAAFTISDSTGTCPPLVDTFINLSQHYISLLWNFGDGTSSTVPNPVHFYNTSGTFTVVLTVTAEGGCIDSTKRTIKLKGPQGSFTYTNLEGCAPLTTHFTATTLNAASEVWDFADGNTLAGNNLIVNHTYTLIGSYLPKLILIDRGGCQVAITGIDTIKVYGAKAYFNLNKTSFCDSATVNFRDSSTSADSIIRWVWSFGDGTFSNLQNPVHSYLIAGSYTVWLSVTTSRGCVNTFISNVPIIISPIPKITATAGPNACAPATIHFNANQIDTSLVTWLWDFGNGVTSTLQNPPDQVYPTAGTYNISVTATNRYGCSTIDTNHIQVYPIPTILTNANTQVCRGQSVSLTATGGNSYIWTPNAGLTCSTCPDPTARPDTTTLYRVTGTSQFGCSDTASVLITIIEPEPFRVGPGDTLCLGESVTLNASGTDNFLWSPSTGLSSTTVPNPTATPIVTTLYTVIGSDSHGCFSDTSTILVKVNPVPTVVAGPDKTINVGQSVNLVPTLSSDVISAVWSPSTWTIANNYPAVTVKPPQTTQYTIDVKNQFGCVAEDHLTIFIICNNANVYIPNTFSPNGDGVNDIFYPRGTGIFSIKTFRIFNRWGELVFEQQGFIANDPSKGWNGTYKGKALTPDVFVYTIDIVCENNQVLTYKGNVALIR